MEVQSYQKQDILGYYKVLNVSPYASFSEIRRAYYAQALLYHPDKNKSKEAEIMFKVIVQAYEVLGNPEKRSQYDALTYSFVSEEGSFHCPSFLLGTILGNVFIYGASVGIIVCPLWGWVLGPTLLLMVVAPTLLAKNYVKLSAMCSGIALAPVVMAEVGIKLSYNIASCVIHTITSMYSRQFPQIEDIEDGWVELTEK